SSSQLAVSTTTKKRANWMVGKSTQAPGLGIRPRCYIHSDATLGTLSPLGFPHVPDPPSADSPLPIGASPNPEMTHPETVAAPSRDPRRRPRYRLTRRGKVVFTVLPVLILAGVWVATADEATLSVDGIEDDAMLGAEASDSTVVVTTDAP